MNRHTKLCLIRLSALLCDYYITFYIHTQTHTGHYTEQRQTKASSCVALSVEPLYTHTQGLRTGSWVQYTHSSVEQTLKI